MQIIGELDASRLESGLSNTIDKIYMEFNEEAMESGGMFFEKNAKNVPLDTGRLRAGSRAGDAIETHRVGNMLIMEVTYSAYNPKTGFNYAWEQETNLEYHHPRGGNAMYLEAGIQTAGQEIFNRWMDKFVTILQEEI